MERILKSKFKIKDKMFESPTFSTYAGSYVDQDKPVIIKIYLREFLDSTIIKKLKKEAVRLEKLSLSGVPKLLDADYGWQGFYFIRDYVDAKTLGELKMPLDIDAASKLLAGICEITGAAHDAGYIHGSLTPSNIFIDADNRPSVTDFGIKSTVEFPQERRGSYLVKGAPVLLAPEVLLGEDISVRSDIYQAGALLFFMLTGEMPLKSGTGLAPAIDGLRTAVALPSSINNKVPRYLDEIVAKCMEKDKDLRFETMAQLLDCLNDRSFSSIQPGQVEIPKIDYSAVAQPEPAEKKNDFTAADKNKKPVNMFKWVFFAMWAAVAAGIIYSLINIFFFGD